MDATRPLLGNDDDDDRERDDRRNGSPSYYHSHSHTHNGHADASSSHAARRRASLLILEDTASRDADCCTSVYRIICCLSSSSGYNNTHSISPSSSNGYKELPPHHHNSHHSHRDKHLLSNGTTSSSTGSSDNGTRNGHHHHQYTDAADSNQGFSCTNWGCWKWVFPDRISDYNDFAASEEMGEIHYMRQQTREFFDASHANDAEMVHHLWNALFPTLPYDGRVNPRWRDIGFQNNDPGSDLRSSGRFCLKMLLYFADHMNDEFKRLVRENRFPVCLCAINVIEMLLIHLNLKEPLPLVCPCCATDNAELETSNPSRDRPELRGFLALLNDCSWSARGRSSSSSVHASNSQQMNYTTTTSEWPVEVAFAQLFMHTMVVLDSVWKHKLHMDPSMTLMHFREALHGTCQKVVAFLSRRNSPVDLIELAAWSARYKNSAKMEETSQKKKKTSKKCM